ncbi:olfactory receptor 2AG2-like [Orycteropus afer afer]|uniref:Olfactory receptor 2AG2-like n=1 Tax=Orycteropus afer afer TaxID=1230840 RepID=A0A8B7B4E0_ORYAF|nr:olfactory receptor 2AG2-like [Orycteropus afer afer]
MGKGNETAPNSFILLGLFSDSKYPGILISIILVIYVIAVTGNSILILLIWLDSQLHIPMYVLLSQLSLMDLTLTTSTITKMAIDFFSGKRYISQVGCGTQMFFYLTVGIAECVFLKLMAYDRYVAICNPLRYPVLMSPRVCLMMVIISWGRSAFTSLSHTSYIMHFPTCGSREIHHFFCEVMAFLKLSCEDTSIYEKVVLVTGTVLLLIPFGLILASYALIFLTVLRMNSLKGRNKALVTCSSHLTVVSLYFGPIMIIYITPCSSLTLELNQHLFVFDTVITPLLNPFIYSLRNKEVMKALKMVLSISLMSK